MEIQRKDTHGDWYKETWVYTYDALGRRIGKGRLKANGDAEILSDGLKDHACLKTENSKDILDSEIAFLWDGSHLLQEHNSGGLYTYIYTDQDSYEPLAQIRDWTDIEGESKQQTHYFHCDQIGIPREMTDKDGNLLWFGDYYGWGKLKSETNINNAHQPFRLQNQYYDEETGLHYNFFRYYEPDAGRFINQDPVGLIGGENFYQFALNMGSWIDPLGLNVISAVLHLANGKSINLGIFRAIAGAKNIPGRTGDAEQLLLKELKEKFAKDTLKGTTLEIKPEKTFIRTKNGKTVCLTSGISPCQHCDSAMDDFAKDNEMKIKYHYRAKVASYPK